jgi:hypothetical protein
MKVWLAAVLVMAQVSGAYAQTTPAPETPPEALAPAIAGPPCADLPPTPDPANVASASTAQMSAASDRQTQWRAQAAEVIECRRLYYNAAIARFNEVNSAWSAQLDAFCTRRGIRCTDRDESESPAPAQ